MEESSLTKNKTRIFSDFFTMVEKIDISDAKIILEMWRESFSGEEWKQKIEQPFSEEIDVPLSASDDRRMKYGH